MVDLCEQEGLAFLPWAPILDTERHSALDKIAAAHGASAKQVVLAWLLARSPAILPIPGTGSVAHLEENVAAAGLILETDEIALLNEPV
jgi:pyridoxine 4-dehydrogenase